MIVGGNLNSLAIRLFVTAITAAEVGSFTFSEVYARIWSFSTLAFVPNNVRCESQAH